MCLVLRFFLHGPSTSGRSPAQAPRASTSSTLLASTFTSQVVRRVPSAALEPCTTGCGASTVDGLEVHFGRGRALRHMTGPAERRAG